MSDIRKQVMAQLITYMSKAQAEGGEPYSAARSAFPAVPDAIVAEAWAELDAQTVEAWWQSIEKTIDGEVIRHALEAPR